VFPPCTSPLSVLTFCYSAFVHAHKPRRRTGSFICVHVHAPPLDVVVAHAACRLSEAILGALGGLYMQDCRYELPRIPLLRGWVNKGKKAGRDLSRIGPPILRELTRRAQPRSFYTSPKSVELLNLAALHDASTLPSVKEPPLLYGEAGESRA
jgi:hypothetical protein